MTVRFRLISCILLSCVLFNSMTNSQFDNILEPQLDIEDLDVGDLGKAIVQDDDDDDDDETLERKKMYNAATIPYGEPCLKSNPTQCMLYPIVQCIHVVAKIYVCRCDFLHTWDSEAQKCHLNVLAPCLEAGETVPCGANMECVKDTLGISDEDRFCRCIKGYKMVENEDKIPAFCVADPKYVEEDEEVFITNRAQTITSKLFLLSYLWHLSTFFISFNGQSSL